MGLIISKDPKSNNRIARLTTWDCNKKKPLICHLNASQFSVPQKPVKFPCMPNHVNLRKKRAPAEGYTDLKVGNKASKYIIGSELTF